MIRFLRTIRQNLPHEEETTCVFISVIGAIFLDVIGIFAILPPTNLFKSVEP